METRHEACSAEGQPRNILEYNPNRFAARCLALSRHCHRFIHSCYAFLPRFWKITLLHTGARPGAIEFSTRMDRPDLARSSPKTVSGTAAAHAIEPPAPPVRVNDAPTRAAQSASIRNRSGHGAPRFSLIQNHTADCADHGERPLSDVAACCAHPMGIVMDGQAVRQQMGGTMRVLNSRC
jgi:hypothetical protein